MPWHRILGHDEVVSRFRRALAQDRLATSFLFVGPPGVGKRMFALKLAQSLLCPTRPAEQLDPCDVCPACAQVLAGTHPDLEMIAKPADKSFIPLELLIGDKEHRMQEGLCYNLSLRPYMGGRKIALIDDADYLNAEGANCLLKTLEEPPAGSVLILIGTSPARQLPTIRSRCQVVRFSPLEPAAVAQLLLEQGQVTDRQLAEQLAQASEGSLQRAGELNDPQLWKFRQWLYEQLAQRLGAFADAVKAVAGFVDEAGRDAPPRRQRLRLVIGMAGDFYRGLLGGLVGRPGAGDPVLQGWVGQAMPDWPGGPAAAAAALDACLDAAEQVDRNANQATLIESWLDQLAAAGCLRIE